MIDEYRRPLPKRMHCERLWLLEDDGDKYLHVQIQVAAQFVWHLPFGVMSIDEAKIVSKALYNMINDGYRRKWHFHGGNPAFALRKALDAYYRTH